MDALLAAGQQFMNFVPCAPPIAPIMVRQVAPAPAGQAIGVVGLVPAGPVNQAIVVPAGQAAHVPAGQAVIVPVNQANDAPPDITAFNSEVERAAFI